MGNNHKQAGFGTLEIVILCVIIAALAGASVFIYQRLRVSPTNTTTSKQSTNQQQSHPPTPPTADPYAGWHSFTDNAKTGTSGISIKYPSDWQVDIPQRSNAVAWSISQAANTRNSINVTYVFKDGSQTAQQEWQACHGTDACGGSSDDKVLTGSESTINGLDAYTATIQNSNGTYHVTVIRGNKATTAAGTPFVWFTTTTSDPMALDIFGKITASATFAN